MSTGSGVAAPGLDAVLAAVDDAATRPGFARHVAEDALTTSDPEVVTAAHRVLGLVAWSTGHFAAALDHLRTAVRVAEDAVLAVRSAEARMSLAFVLTEAGQTGEALAELDRAAPRLRGAAAARLHTQRALILMDVGRLPESATWFDAALTTLRRAGGHPLLEANIRTNRGILRAYRSNWQGAEHDLRKAESLYLSNGHDRLPATAHHNIGFVAARRGDVPAALTSYDRAQEQYQADGNHPGLLAIDRADALLSVRLLAEARSVAQDAVTEFAGMRMAASLARARLVLAYAALLDGDRPAARAEAGSARRAFVRQRTPGYAALARHLELRADWEDGKVTEAALRAGRRSVAELRRTGWVVAAVDAQLIVARTALALGRRVSAHRELAAVALARHRGPADLRSKAWHAEALRRLSAGDRRGACSALRAGIRVVDGFQASLGASELRAHTSGHGAELARLGVELAVDAGRPAAVLEWAERWRAGSLRLRPARPPDDAELADELADLRQTAADLDAAAADGRDTAALLRRQVHLEASVRRRHRHAPGAAASDRATTPVALRAAVGDAALVEYVAVGDQLHAVVLTRLRTRLHRIGDLAAVRRELDALRFGLRRLAHQLGAARSLDVVARSAEHASRRLDALLLHPLRSDIRDRDLVVIPTGALHAMPWAALPSCAGRSLSVAPSAALWNRAQSDATPTDGRCVFVAGPHLPHAVAEIAAASREYPGADRLTGRQAGVARVTAALEAAEMAHIASHGHIRADNPLFSSLQLADGPLTVYDLERMRRPPRHVVLSACDSGVSTVHEGDELQGLAAALLGLGTRSLVVTMIPVADRIGRDLMIAFHAHRRHGRAPAEALARAQHELCPGPPTGVEAAVQGFLCFGAG